MVDIPNELREGKDEYTILDVLEADELREYIIKWYKHYQKEL